MNRRERVALVLREVRNLPALPDVAVKLLELDPHAGVSAQDVASLIAKDMGLTARVLKLVNSPFFGLRREVTSVQQAVLFLGVSNLRSLVLSSAALELFSRDGTVGSFSRNEFWKHSLAVAAAARKIAAFTRLADPDMAFTAGLIHDMGKIIVDKHLHEEFVKIVLLCEQRELSMAEAEERVLGVNHSEIGMHLAARWNLPAVLQCAVGNHHAPHEAPAHAEIAALIAVADAAVRSLSIGSGGGADPALAPEILALTGLTDPDFHHVVKNLLTDLEEQVALMVAG